LRAHNEGTVTLTAAPKVISQGTRRYTKRQLTWSHKEPTVHSLPGLPDDIAIAAAAGRLVARHLRFNAAP